MAGTLIVIDGIDSSGKATQAKLLANRLLSEGKNVERIEFPRYGVPVFGELLGECLAGKHGDFAHLDPKIASTLYALDRYEAKTRIAEWLSKGSIIISDRYTSSNQIHQGGKIIDKEKREAFLSWITRMEYEVLGIPKPERTIYLRVPVETSLALLTNEREKKNAALDTSGLDVVEKDRMYVERSFESAEELAHKESWKTIECVAGGALRSPEEIAEEVYKAVSDLINHHTN